MQNVLITGASGLIGSRLTELLLQKGYSVSHLSQSKGSVNTNVNVYNWNVTKGIMDIAAVRGTDYIIHLAGEPIAAKRWTITQKKKIVESRTLSTQLLAKAIAQSSTKPKAFIAAAGIGYYGAITSDNVFKETDLPGSDFLAHTCISWENSADKIGELGIRTVKLRTAVVLSTKDGALLKLEKPIRYYIGSPLGTGKQYLPWIHIDDLCAIYIKAIEDEKIQGAYNAVAPEHVSNKDFTIALAKQLHKPLLLPKIPELIVKLLMGEMACVVLEGSRIASEKISKTGFVFKYPSLEEALKAIYSKNCI